MTRLLAAVLLGSVLFVAVGARAQSRNPLIAQGSQQVDDLEFDQALQTLSAALVRSGNTPADSATIYRLLAFTYLALGRQEEATGAYRSLLGLQPDFQPGADVAPRTRTFFAAVRTQWEADGRPGVATAAAAPVTIRHRSPPQAVRHTAVTLDATLEDPDHRVARVVLAYHQGSSAVFTRADCERTEEGYRATIPADAVAPPLVEYYFEALDGAGLPVAARGDAAAPLRIAVPAPGGAGIAGEWWFWTLIGVAVAAAIVIPIVYVASQPPSGPAQGTFILHID